MITPMIVLIPLLPVALIPMETPLADSSVLAPAGGVGLFLWLVWQAAKNYKEGRKTDVAAAEKREQDTKQKAEVDAVNYQSRIQTLQADLDREREDRRRESDKARSEQNDLRDKITRMTLRQYELTQVLASHGIAPPGFGSEVTNDA